MNELRELALFAGIGGSCLAGKLLGFRTVGYVENDPFCQETIQRRIADGFLDAAPIFGDIQRFNAEGWAGRYCGKVDLVSGGFPCQDISNAGKRAGIEGERSGLWSEMRDTVRLVRPRYVFIENVAALVGRGLDRVLADLAELGFDATWDCFRASDVGAPHRRERVFVLGHTRSEQRSGDAGSSPKSRCIGTHDGIPRTAGCDVALSSGESAQLRRGSGELGSAAADARGERHQRERSGNAARTGGATLADGDEAGCGWPRGILSQDRNAQRGDDLGDGGLEIVPCPDGGGRWHVGNGWDVCTTDEGLARIRAELADGYEPDAQGAERGAGTTGLDGGAGRAGSGGLSLGTLGGLAFPPNPSDWDAWSRLLAERPDLAPSVGNAMHSQSQEQQGDDFSCIGRTEFSARSWPASRNDDRTSAAQPPVRQSSDGLPDWMDRAFSARTNQLRGLGNAWVPLVGALAFRMLLDRLRRLTDAA